MSLIQMAKSATVLDYRLMKSGLGIFLLTMLAAFMSYVDNATSVETNINLITNAINLFFINDIDERAMSTLNILMPDWTDDRIHKVKRNLLKRCGKFDKTNIK